MRTKKLSKKEVLAKLKQAQEKDLKYEDGKILCSMCTTPHAAAKQAHEMFLDSNLGDPELFQGSMQLEKEVVAELAELLHAPQTCAGFIVSGGTEANLMAMYAARNAAKTEAPEVVVPESAHFSFDKICRILKIKQVKAKLDADFRVDPASVEQQITKRTVAVVGNAGSAELGTVDPIDSLSKVAVAHGVPLHVDAAFGGLVLPFLKELGYAAPEFDFKLAGVESVTVDPHKMGMSTIAAGGILFRHSKTLQYLKTETPYLTQPYQCTFVGTRPAASAAATWAVFASLGHEGFKKTVAHCMTLTTQLYEGLEEAGFEVLLRPQMNIAAFHAANPKRLTQKLRQKGWYVSQVPRLSCIRLVMMPHTTTQHVTDFLQCLKQVYTK
ncbi:MAG: tyrosine decarboxylase MfnA [Candidatus Bathyarchaeota archaeon]|nr:tyrosine decarboxylase MfnA [Candidatus Bathyarchaeota archaeon]